MTTYDYTPDELVVVIRRGDTLHWVLSITEDGSAVNAAGWTVEGQIRSTPDAGTAIDMAVDSTNAASGIFVLSVSEADSQTAGTSWVFDIQVTTDDTPPQVITIAKGSWNADPDVTR